MKNCDFASNASVPSTGLGSGGGAYTRYNVPIGHIDGRTAFEVPDAVDLTKDTIAVEGKFTHSPELDYTVDNAGTAGVGRFVFAVAPTEQIVLRYLKG